MWRLSFFSPFLSSFALNHCNNPFTSDQPVLKRSALGEWGDYCQEDTECNFPFERNTQTMQCKYVECTHQCGHGMFCSSEHAVCCPYDCQYDVDCRGDLKCRKTPAHTEGENICTTQCIPSYAVISTPFPSPVPCNKEGCYCESNDMCQDSLVCTDEKCETESSSRNLILGISISAGILLTIAILIIGYFFGKSRNHNIQHGTGSSSNNATATL